jgi:hypothetical protein
MKMLHSSIEPLEARVAPAKLVGNVLTYTDIDGDLVKVTFTHATMDSGNFTFSTGTANDGDDTPRTLDAINLGGKTGAGFTLTATPHAGKGDSHANVATIFCNISTALGKLKVDGDVRAITSSGGDLSVESFSALSMGLGNSVGVTINSYLSSAGTFSVKGSVAAVALDFSGGVKSLSIGGNLGAVSTDTFLHVGGAVGSFKVGGSIIGKGTDQTVRVGGDVGAFSVGGSIVGGPDDLPLGVYQIDLHTAKSIVVGGDLRGGPGNGGGSINVGGTVAKVKFGGSIVGALDVALSGSFFGEGVGSFTIGHDLVINVDGSNTAQNGSITSTGNIGSLKIGGDIIAYPASGSAKPATIIADGTIGTLSVGGSILGAANRPVYILAAGVGAAAGTPAIKSFIVKHNVELARIVAGYGRGFVAANIDAGIGHISIGGNLTGTQIDVGSSTGGDGKPGTVDDGIIPTSLARIDSIKIGGALTGIAGDSTTYYVQAPVIKKATIGRAIYSEAQLHGYLDFNALGKAAIGGLA